LHERYVKMRVIIIDSSTGSHETEERRDDANNQNNAEEPQLQKERERNLVPGKNDVKTRFGVAFERSIPDAIPPRPPGGKNGGFIINFDQLLMIRDQEMPLASGGWWIIDTR
jgi:hypothetical protein